MLYIQKINDYLEVLTNEEVKDFVAINFSKYFKSIEEEQNLSKVAKSLYLFLTAPDVLQVGTGENPTTPLYSKTKKVKNF